MILDGNKVNRKMEENLYTATSLSKEKKIAYASISNARNGKGVSMGTVRKLCEAFNCKPADLLKDEN